MAKKGPVTKNWFDEVEPMDNNGVFTVRQGLMWGLYDSMKNRFLIPVDCHSITEVKYSEQRVLYIVQGLKIGYYNFSGRGFIVSECDDVVGLDDERPWINKVRKGEKWQICDLKKGKVISPTFDEIELLNGFTDNNTLFQVSRGEKLGLFDMQKEEVVMPVQYDEICEDDVTRFKVRMGDKWGLFDTDLGTFVIDLEYEKISCVGGGDVYQVELDGKIGFIKLQS